MTQMRGEQSCRRSHCKAGATGAKPVVIRDWKRPAAVGYALIIFTFVVLGGWSAVAKLDSAVTAPGLVAEENSRKSVQHLEGGIIKEILVREGQHVTAGQVLFRLDPTQAQSSLDLQQTQLDALLAKRPGSSQSATARPQSSGPTKSKPGAINPM